MICTGNERAFCSGGDVKLIANHSEPGYGQEFFRLEYLMNYVVATYGLPYVALIDGIVMGGGVGISLHGTFRVATEHTVFAMPETLIGFFPDVGTCHPLSRMRNHLGYYLATTGARLHGKVFLRIQEFVVFSSTTKNNNFLANKPHTFL